MNQRKIASACSNAHAKGNCHLSRSFVLFRSHALDTRARCECTTRRHCTASVPASEFVYYLFISFLRPSCMVNEMHAARTATKFAHRLFFSLMWGLVAWVFFLMLLLRVRIEWATWYRCNFTEQIKSEHLRLSVGQTREATEKKSQYLNVINVRTVRARSWIRNNSMQSKSKVRRSKFFFLWIHESV